MVVERPIGVCGRCAPSPMIERRRGGRRWQRVDLNSREGTRIGGQRVKEAMLDDGESFELAGTVKATLSLRPVLDAKATGVPSPDGAEPEAGPQADASQNDKQHGV